jgi:arsenite methyltransferase
MERGMNQSADELREAVRARYSAAAAAASRGEAASCCGGVDACGCGCADPISGDLYSALQTAELPGAAVLASLGCGNPTALAELAPGETVLDLGSGGGIDVLLSARRVGPTGQAYGLDMTDEMLQLARANQRAAGITNVEFLKGDIASIPLPDGSVDVIISNCVVNLAGDKRAVIGEAWRVLRPGGRLAVSDVVVRGELPDVVRRNMELWVGCIAGALTDVEFRRLLGDVGFVDIGIEPTRVYRPEDARAFLADAGVQADDLAGEQTGEIMAAFVRAWKPVAEHPR